MAVPQSIATFLSGERIAVAGVSRSGDQPANAIFRRLRETGHEVVPVNPKAAEVEGETCYPDLTSIPGKIDAVMVVTHPDDSIDVIRQAAARGVRQVWFHRSFGDGSLSDAAVNECRNLGIEPIVGGCPMMFCGRVDPFHACARWIFGMMGRVPR